MGAMLKIKPILTFVDKKIVPFEKIRTQQKAMKRIEQLFADETGTTDGDGYELVIIHANAPEAGEAWRQKMQEQYPMRILRHLHQGEFLLQAQNTIMKYVI